MRLALAAATLLLSACLGTMNNAFRVHGVITSGERCLLTAVNSDTLRKEEWEVSGEFTEMVVAGPAPPPYTVTVSCNGQVRKTLGGVRPGYENWQQPVELGNIAR